MLKAPPVPKDEQAALRYINALIKNYEPQFELQGNFTSGVFGCADPQYRAIRREWRHDLVRKGFMKEGMLSLEEASDDLLDRYSEETQADSRLNWRVTTQHGAYLIHLMALDKTFQRFAFALQTKADFERSVGSYRDRPFYYQYKAVTHLSELKPILDEVYESLRREEQERRQRDRIDEAVAKERDKWVERLAKERENRRLVVYSVIFIAVLLAGGFVVDAINKHFYGVPIDIALTASGAGILAFVGAFLYFWGLATFDLKVELLKDGKPAPLLMWSAWIVFFALWFALAHVAFKGLI